MYEPIFPTATERWFLAGLTTFSALSTAIATSLGRDVPSWVLIFTAVVALFNMGIAITDTVGLWANRMATEAWEDGFERGREVGPRS